LVADHRRSRWNWQAWNPRLSGPKAEAFVHQRPTHGDPNRKVDRQDLRRHDADARSADEDGVDVLKVVVPAIAAGMKQPRDCSGRRFNARYVRALVPIAPNACKREIVLLIVTLVLQRDHMIDDMPQLRRAFRQKAILAAIRRASAHQIG